MYTVFFEFEGITYFYGHIVGKATTGFSDDIGKARSDLDARNAKLASPLRGSAATRSSFVQGMVRREVDIASDGSVTCRNYFPESLIVEFRIGEPSNLKSCFTVFLLKSKRWHINETSLERAIDTAEGLHQFAMLDPSKWPELAEEAGLT
ncbi:hypothetical protein [Rhizobium laguerreae]|uniref:hypothetical protein n=1 Tax=Rhizobium laguerreae TaxID=1076926 RepID=UPI001C92123E|nr:hypothetical protein [Rhizobium laguerreae]MBY3356035.1 hypothetical protein [Rhizobium laguerreae]MBY3455023.1 hypothetical protein [Rhizobium laguerreae]MBY3462192.1 hypothetical protein [Rhizobium laguerreae]